MIATVVAGCESKYLKLSIKTIWSYQIFRKRTLEERATECTMVWESVCHISYYFVYLSLVMAVTC